MNDTTPEITEKVAELFRKKSPIERLKMGCSMYDTSRYLVIRAILEENPGISEVGLRQELFIKFYGNDFDLNEKEKILNQLKIHHAMRGEPLL